MTQEKINQYLLRIKYNTTPRVDAITLLKLQKQHLLTVPFENLDIHFHKPITINIDSFYEKIITEKRGGFCYELNGLFNDLLTSIGFETILVSARPFNTISGAYSEEFNHLAIIAFIDNKKWLVDVGFGEFTLNPLAITTGLEQDDGRNVFKINEIDKTNFLVQKKGIGNDWQNEYASSQIPRKIEEFAGKCYYHQTSPASHFTHGMVCSMVTENGRVTLTDKALKITEGNNVLEKVISNLNEFKLNLEKHFGIELKKNSKDRN